MMPEELLPEEIGSRFTFFRKIFFLGGGEDFVGNS